MFTGKETKLIKDTVYKMDGNYNIHPHKYLLAEEIFFVLTWQSWQHLSYSAVINLTHHNRYDTNTIAL
jgi:hypothetical protein